MHWLLAAIRALLQERLRLFEEYPTDYIPRIGAAAQSVGNGEECKSASLLFAPRLESVRLN